MKVKSEVAQSLSRVQLLVTPWTAAHQAPPSMGCSSQEYWSGGPLPSLKLLLRVGLSLTSQLQLGKKSSLIFFKVKETHKLILNQ